MKIVFGGDVCFSNLPEEFDFASFSRVLQDVKPLFHRADYSMVNLECVLPKGETSPIPKIGPALYGDRRSIAFLEELKVTVAGLANNHTGDRGEQAILDTLELLSDHSIAAIGAGRNIEDAYRSYLLEKDGVRVSLIALCENEFGTAKKNKAGSAGFDLYRLKDRLQEEKKVSDHVIVFFHGGNEENPFPSPGKTKLYRFMIDLGASAVIAGHTHCPQGYEIYQGAPIVYSMGNFFFPCPGKAPDSAWNFGLLPELTVGKSAVSLALHPYYSHPDGSGLRLLTGKEKDSFFSYLQKLSEPLSDEERIKELFDIWATIFGIRYAKHVIYISEMLTAGPSVCAKLKNIFNCEAHNELIHALMELCYEERFLAVKEHQQQILQYQTVHLHS